MIISITHRPRQLWTWEYYHQNRTIKLHFMRHQWRVFGVLSKNAGFYPSSDRIVEINAQTLVSGTWRQIIQQTNILPTPVGLPVCTQRLSGSHVGSPPHQWLNTPIYRRSRPPDPAQRWHTLA